MGGCGWIARAAHLKKPHGGFFARRTVRRALRVALAAFSAAPLGRALKKQSAAPASPPCFRRRRRSAPLLFESTRPALRKVYKTENPVPGSDTGFLGGRGWIRTTEAEKQQIYSLSPLATREHAQILFTSVAGRLVYFIRLRAICQLLFSDFCSFSAEAVGRISFGSDVSGARNPARRQWLRRTWGRGQ